MLEAVKSPQGTLLEHIKDRKRLNALTDSVNFVYSRGDKEHHFTIKCCEVQFKTERCDAILIHDHTALYELSKLDEKYTKIFLASIVHDIRTPIQGIMGVLDSLDTEGRTQDEKQYIGIGKSVCKLLTFLTYDITDLGQIEAGRFSLNYAAFSPVNAVKECMGTLSFSYSAKRLGLDLATNNFSGMIYSDEHRYMQILMNLLGNAMKFTISGRVTVTLTRDMLNDLLLTEVSDTGVGIREEDLPHLFKMFGKLQSSAAINPHGVGLGLTICKMLSEALGGYILVRSQFGRGSSFVFAVRARSGECGDYVDEPVDTFPEGERGSELKIPEKCSKFCAAQTKLISYISSRTTNAVRKIGR